jgi:peptidyl-prolyl cis-trans isomerase D
MSKEKNIQQPEPRKDSTSVLEKIRRRTGLLVGIVGLALIIFILESLLGSGASIFGGDEMTTMGSVNGKKIDRNEFVSKLENQLNGYRQRNQGQEVDESVRSQVVESILQQYVVEYVMKPQFAKAGITVGEDEVYQNVVVNPDQSVIQNLTDPNTQKINEQFARPDGSLDLVKWRQAVQNVTGESEMAVRQMEEMVKSSLFFNKFRSLITKGLYVTKAEAAARAKTRGTTADLTLVLKKYESVSDSAVKPTDAELEKYYSSNPNLYLNPENTRKIDYVTFNVSPSAEDLSNIEKDALRAAEEFRKLPISEDSSFIAQESENGNISIKNFDKKSMTIRDSSVFTAAPGTVFGPYNEGAYYKIYKLEAINSVADSARVRHILIGTSDPQTQQPKRSKEQAKKEADSLLVLLKDHKVSFDSLVNTVSDDMGSKTNGGDYGWFDENEGFVEPFKNAGLMGKKGNISVVETQFGYHIIEVLDVSNTRHTSYRVAEILKPIAPSDETNQKIFAQANQFGGENNTAELFDKAVASQKLVPRVADNVKEGEYNLPGLEGAKDLVKWAFKAEKGEVGVFSLQGKHVVAKLVSIKNKGVLPLEDVKDQVTRKVIQEKKASMFLEEFKNNGGQNIQTLASKMGLEPIKADHVSMEGRSIPNVGSDQVVIGTAQGVKEGSTSRATAGETGVFVLKVDKINHENVTTDLKQVQTEAEQAIAGRTDYEVYNALKQISDIDFHKSRVD